MAAPVKHDWYQTETHVVVNILVKNTKEEGLDVKCEDNNLSVQFLGADGDAVHFKVVLAHPVVQDSISVRRLSTKIEVKMAKQEGIRWATLEAPVKVAKEPLATQESGPPKYPTSSARGRDWDRVEAEIAREEEGEKPEGEAALNSLFQKIYSQGSDEVKKAMNKSFSESGGTVLSTNWNEVERDKIEVKAPAGMEWKHWDSA